VRERRDVREQRVLHVLAGDEDVHRFEARLLRCRNEILALRDEEPELVAPPALVQLPNELELLVLA